MSKVIIEIKTRIMFVFSETYNISHIYMSRRYNEVFSFDVCYSMDSTSPYYFHLSRRSARAFIMEISISSKPFGSAVTVRNRNYGCRVYLYRCYRHRPLPDGFRAGAAIIWPAHTRGIRGVARATRNILSG